MALSPSKRARLALLLLAACLALAAAQSAKSTRISSTPAVQRGSAPPTAGQTQGRKLFEGRTLQGPGGNGGNGGNRNPKPPKPPPAPASVTTPVPAPTPISPITCPTSVPISAWMAQMLVLVNQARADNLITPVCWNVKLIISAQMQSDGGIWGHTWDYVTATGYNWSWLGQNIAWGHTNVEWVFTDWMNSPGHRANILNPNFSQFGVGWNTGNNMWTQNFGRSDTEPCMV